MKLKIWLQILLVSFGIYTQQFAIDTFQSTAEGTSFTLDNISVGNVLGDQPVSISLKANLNFNGTNYWTYSFSDGTPARPFYNNQYYVPFSIMTQPSHGTITLNNNTANTNAMSYIQNFNQTYSLTITYTPDPGYSGPDSFTYSGDFEIIYYNNRPWGGQNAEYFPPPITHSDNLGTVTLNVIQERAYVTSSPSSVSTLTQINVTDASKVNITSQPDYYLSSDMAVSLQTGRAYVCYPDSNKISVINTNTNAWILDISDPNGYLNSPTSIAVSPDGTKAYVLNSVTLPSQAAVSVVDLVNNIVTRNISNSLFYQATSIAFTPDGTRVYVATTSNPAGVYMITAATESVTIVNSNVGSNFYDIAISSDGNYAYLVQNIFSGGDVYILDTNPSSSTYNRIIGTINHGSYSAPFQGASSMALTADGKKAYVANTSNNTVAIIDLNPSSSTYRCVTGFVDNTTVSFNSPSSVAIDQYGLVAYVTNYGAANISVINVATNAATSAVSLSVRPKTVCFLSYNPIANAQSLPNVEQNSTINAITLTGADARNQTLTYAIATQPSHGTLTGLNASTGAVNYIPTSGYTGTDSFTFTATNTSGYTSLPAKISIVVTPCLVSATTTTFGVDEAGTPRELTLGASGGTPPYTYYLVSAPTRQYSDYIFSANGNITYTPAVAVGNYTDSLTYYVKDVYGVPSANQVVTIVVESPPGPNTVSPQYAYLNGGAQRYQLGVGVNGGTPPYTYSLVSNPANGGTLTGLPNQTGTAYYTPKVTSSSYNDSFTYNATDSLGVPFRGPSTTLVSVLAGPTVNAQSVSCNVNSAAVITLTGSDALGQPLTYAIAPAPTNGFVSAPTTSTSSRGVSTTQCVYTPNPGYVGSDAFSVVARNTSGASSSPATISITVNDLPPIVNSQSINIAKGSSSNLITLTGMDLGNQAMSYAITTSPSHGTLSGLNPSTGAVYYATSSSSYTGPDSFTFTATNTSSQTSARATVSINIIPLIANASTVQFGSNTTGNTVQLSAAGGNSPYTFTLVTPPSHASSYSLSSLGLLTYTPTSGYVGLDSCTFTATDRSGVVSNIGTVSILVGPLALPFTVYAPINTLSYPITMTGQTVNGQTVSCNCPSNTTQQNGSLGSITQLINGQASTTYIPPHNFIGVDSFLYTATGDGGVTSAPARVTINVGDNPVAIPPAIVNATTGTSRVVSLTGSSQIGQPLSFNVPLKTVNGGTLTYLSSTSTSATYSYLINGYCGTDSFNFTVQDSSGIVSPSATVEIYVSDGTPYGFDATLNTLSGISQLITLTATDPGNQPLTFTILRPPSYGTVTPMQQVIYNSLSTNVDQDVYSCPITYTVNENSLISSTTQDSFMFGVTNPDGQSAYAVVNITIAVIPDGAGGSSVAVTNAMVSKYAGT